MNKLLLYITSFLIAVMVMSCESQLRIDERQISHDVNYFTYSRYQLTTAIVDIATGYGRNVVNEELGQLNQHFMDCYESDRVSGFYTNTASDWESARQNPYTNSLRTLAAVTELATNEGNEATVAVADILKCFLGGILTEKYGDIPFSEAVMGREGIIFPKFDTQKEVYELIFDMLDGAVAKLSATSSALPADHDVLFNGDKEKWVKFANSLKFRLMVHSYEAFKKAGRDLSSEMQAIANGNKYISTVEDNAGLLYSGTQESESWPLQTNWGTGNDYTEQKPTKYLIDELVALDDPRLFVIFGPVLSPISSKTEVTEEDIKINGFDYHITYYPTSHPTIDPAADLKAPGRDMNGNAIEVPYVLDAKWFGTPTAIGVTGIYGGSKVPGTKALFANERLTGLSGLMAKTNDERLKAVLMESSEMMFLLAEARSKGWITAGTASDFYTKGIKLSFERWGIIDGAKPATHIGSDEIVDDYDAYCAKVALNGTNDLDKIALQKWFSFVMIDEREAVTEVRRTSKPAFVKPIAESFGAYDYPLRYTYPLNEASNNKEMYDAAVSSMGGDLASTQMWILK